MNIRSPRFALASLFLVDGTGFGVWASHLPLFRQTLGITNLGLSVILFCLVVGSIVAMPLIGQAVAAFGSNRVLRWVAPFYCGSLAVVGFSPTASALAATALFFGAVKGAMDVSINAHAIDLEEAQGRSSMSFLQGFWSVGGLLGAAGSSIALRFRGGVLIHLLVTGCLLGVIVAMALGSLIRAEGKRTYEKFRMPGASLLGLSFLAFFALFSEGVIGDWIAVYLHVRLKVSLSAAAAGFATYAIFMAMGRFAGDWTTEKLSKLGVLQFSGGAVSIGFALTILAPNFALALAGLALTGVGVANVVPVVLQLAAQDSQLSAGPAISAVSTVGYFGFLAGPPLIGWISGGVGLSWALSLVVVSGAVVASSPTVLRALRS
jgi:MFS family permease